MTNNPDSIIPKFPLNDEERESALSDSLLGWKMGRLIPPEQKIQFFNQLWRNNFLHSIDSESEEYKDKLILKKFAVSLQYPFEGGGNFGIESLVGEEHIAFAYTGGYLFESQDGQIEMYLAKNQGVKATPFGDFHDLASSQFMGDIGVPLSGMKNAERCLFFHTFNTSNGQIEYFVIPVETLHHEQTQMRIGENPITSFLQRYNDKQIIDFTKRFSEGSYGITQIIISDPTRKHSISAAIATEQLLPKINERANLRIDHDMDPEQAIREAMRERILSQAGVRSAFGSQWSTENDTLSGE